MQKQYYDLNQAIRDAQARANARGCVMVVYQQHLGDGSRTGYWVDPESYYRSDVKDVFETTLNATVKPENA